MASISTLVDRVKIVVLSSGTGPFQLGAPVPAYRGIEALVDGATYNYAVESGSNFEVGTGVYLSGSGTLVRTPLISSNSGAVVSFPPNVELSFTVLAQDISPEGSTIPVVQTPGASMTAVMSQDAVTQLYSSLLSSLTAQVAGILNGTASWNLPEQTDDDPLPAPGSGLPYLSAGVLKIA